MRLMVVLAATGLRPFPMCSRVGLLTGLILLVFAPRVCLAQNESQSNEELLDYADKAFRRGIENRTRLLESRRHFSEALEAYLQLHERGIRRPALYRNLGNAAVLADRWPEAIWAFHVGLMLDPNDRTLRQHLAIARARVLYPPSGQGRPEPDVWPIWLHRPTSGEVLVFRYFVYLCLCAAVTCLCLKRSIGVFFLVLGLTLVSAGAAGVSWRLAGQEEWNRQTPMVILATTAEFHRGNGPGYPLHTVIPLLPRGLEVRQTHRRGNWLQIRLTSGETGWVHASKALIVER